LHETWATVNGVRLHVVQAGPEDGPLVLLLHGFPEFWYGWRKQIEPLALAGLRVLAPDQRGYNLSQKPAGIRSYSIEVLARDVLELIGSTGRETAMLVGHDWGAAVAWWVALRYPDRLTRLAILNVPHPSVMARALRRSWRQRIRSWYMIFFQMPWLPEFALRSGTWRGLERALLETSRQGAFTASDLELYRRAWAQPGALRSMLHWYRALLRPQPRIPVRDRIRVPTLILWGAHDFALERWMAEASAELCDEVRLMVFEEATHWVQHEEPERVNRALLEFLVVGGGSR